MGIETRLERLTRRTYRIRLGRPDVRESSKQFSPAAPAPIADAPRSRFATGAQRVMRFAARPQKDGST